MKMGVYKLKDIGKRFSNLFCSAYFRCNNEMCTCWILVHFRNPVHDGSAFSFSVISKPKRLVYPVFSSVISSQLLLAFQ